MTQAPVNNTELNGKLAMSTARLEAELAARVDGEIRFDPGTKAAYAQDASNYRQVPLGVVIPRTVDAAVAAISVCREFGVPVLSRGGGTSLAGQCCNEAVVIDWTKYCHGLVSVDPEARTAMRRAGHGAGQGQRRAGRRYGLMVGPKPSTHVSCTIGGMIGNNSCGSTAQAYGKMADSVRRLEIAHLRRAAHLDRRDRRRRVRADHRGRAATRPSCTGDCGRSATPTWGRSAPATRKSRAGSPATTSTRCCPRSGFHVARALVGSESTLVTVLHAEIELVEVPKHRSLVVLGYPDIADAPTWCRWWSGTPRCRSRAWTTR